MRNIYSILEFDVIRESLANFAYTEIGLERCKTLSIIQDKKKLQYELEFLDESIQCLMRYNDIPVKSSSNLNKMIDLAIKGGILTPRDFSLIVTDIRTTQDLVKYFLKIRKDYKLIDERLDNFVDLTKVADKIETVIAPDLTIKSSASEKLSSIRNKIKRLEKEGISKINLLIGKYKEYLSENSYTLRDDQYVLPVQTAYKNKILGIVLDVSDSGSTTFIEPSEIVEISNNLYVAKKDEQEEIKRILLDLTNYLISYKEDLIYNNKLIGYFDFVFAKARYAVENDANVGGINDCGEINLINAKHPLIDKTKVIANTITLNKNDRILLISGPNAGGKTVCMKTLGLFALMHQSGLAITSSEGSYMPYFNNIFVDIGDNQSIQDNLSTFSGHVRNLAYIVDNVNEGDLVLLDEIGTGTSPVEGEALAYSVIRTLIRKHCFAMISSHFEGIKAYALSNKNIQNASMIFDERKLQPTYKLRIGVPGKSYGIDVARRYKMSAEVIELAENYIKGNEKDYLNEAIEQLNVEHNNIVNLKNKEKELKIELQNKVQEVEKSKREYDKKLKELERTFLEEKNKLLENVKQEVDDVIKILSKPDVKLHEVINAKSRLNKNLDIVDEDESLPISTKEITIDCYVEIVDNDIQGRVVKINKDKIDIITTSGLSITTKKDRLVVIDEPERQTIKKSGPIVINKPLPSEINLIGNHVDEALARLGVYLDDARMHKMHEVRIIHGMGSGILRTAIWAYLKKQSFVESYEYAPINLGSSGATIVKLK